MIGKYPTPFFFLLFSRSIEWAVPLPSLFKDPEIIINVVEFLLIFCLPLPFFPKLGRNLGGLLFLSGQGKRIGAWVPFSSPEVRRRICPLSFFFFVKRGSRLYLSSLSPFCPLLFLGASQKSKDSFPSLPEPSMFPFFFSSLPPPWKKSVRECSPSSPSFLAA